MILFAAISNGNTRRLHRALCPAKGQNRPRLSPPACLVCLPQREGVPEDYEDVFKGTINADDTNKVRILTVEWQWAYETETKDTTINQNDEKDTENGLKALDYSFDVIVTGTQVIPTQS